MPGKGKRYGPIARKFLKRRKARRKKSHFAKLLDSKINTATEVAAKRIALAAIQEEKVNLIFRQFLLGGYIRLTNEFQPGTPITYTGFVQHMGQIQKMDNQTIPTVAPAPDPFQTPPTWANPGLNVIAPNVPLSGFRRGDSIKVHGVTLEIRARLPARAGPALPHDAYVDTFYTIYAVNYTDMEQLVTPLPQIGQMLNVDRWGYSPLLDRRDENLEMKLKKRLIARGKFRMVYNTDHTQYRDRNIYVDLADKPLKVTWTSLDQNGQNCERNKVLLCMRSTCPTALAPEAPIVWANTKLHYTDT